MMRTPRLLIVLTFCLLTLPASAGVFEAQEFWKKLHNYERTALQDYRSRNAQPSVLGRSGEIWELQSSVRLESKFSVCASAAQKLSQMVSSTYYDSTMGRIPEDWYYFSTRYQKERRQCLEAIGFNKENYPLPWWFGL